MKTQKKTSLLHLILLCLLIQACNSKFSLTKRHYRKGFYVSHQTKNTNHQETASVKIISQKPISTIVGITHMTEIKNKTNPSLNNIPLVCNATKSNNKLITHKTNTINYRPIMDERLLTRNNLQQVNKQFRLIKHKINTSNSTSENGLSLFWIIIILLLVLWALGFFGGFVGLLINVLLVVALILFILWLLRII